MASDTILCGKLRDTIGHLRDLLEFKRKFTIILDDPSGNSHIENPFYPKEDPNLWILNYKRTWIEDEQLGLESHKIVEEEKVEDEGLDLEEIGKKEELEV